MENPVTVNCPAGQWTLVAENVTSGYIRKLNEQPYAYLSTYRLTGEAAPTDKSEGIVIFRDLEINEKISASQGIDVYLYPITSAGKVRVDI